MAKKGKKVTTIEGLARLMQGEFSGVQRQFGEVHKQFDGVQSQFDGVNRQFDGVHKRLDGLEANVREMKEGSTELFVKLDEFISLYRDTKQELALLARQVKRLEERIEHLEIKR